MWVNIDETNRGYTLVTEKSNLTGQGAVFVSRLAVAMILLHPAKVYINTGMLKHVETQIMDGISRLNGDISKDNDGKARITVMLDGEDVKVEIDDASKPKRTPRPKLDIYGRPCSIKAYPRRIRRKNKEFEDE